MGESDVKMGEVSLKDELTPFGKKMLKRFMFDSSFVNMNHGGPPPSFYYYTYKNYNVDIV